MARNLLFITTDQQRWDSLPCYGLDFMQTPALDRLAAEGMVFENCSVSSPVCVPCRASFLSGQYASTIGVLGNDRFPKCVFVIYSMHPHPNESFTSNLEIGQAPHY